MPTDGRVSEPASKGWMRALERTAPLGDAPYRTFAVVIEELGERHGDAPALLSDGETFSFADLAARAARYTRWALSEGVKPGGTIGLLMENRPEYLAIWLGLTRAGAVVALLNIHQAGPALAHSIDSVAPSHVIVSAALLQAYAAAAKLQTSRPELWTHGEGGEGIPRIDLAVAKLSDARLSAAEVPRVALKDRALYIYTSGTTGLPKAAVVTHFRVMSWVNWFAGMLDTRPDDRMYDCLPLYHSVGGIVATGALLVNGGSVVIVDKFSASRFWNDIVRWDCTVFQYIGELCRYLANAPETAPPVHKLRLCVGNGLRADVWARFQARFAIPRIVEFYAASEGTFSLYNLEGKPGAIGRIPGFMAHRFPAAIVKFDPVSDAPLRDETGRCIKCERNEIGEAIGLLFDGKGQAGRFEGYTNEAETEKKILRDVFIQGDAWVRTGDLMRIDEQGYWYFVDRIGDTFRWKGENVSTLDVSETLAACRGVADALVFGVAIPGADGKAGMAVLSATDAFDIRTLGAFVTAHFATYARPVFVRLSNDIALTETFKHKKLGLSEEGFDPGAVKDPLYVYDPAQHIYLELDPETFERIRRGDIRL